MGNALVDNLLIQEEVRLKDLCKPLVKVAKKQSSIFKNRRIHSEDFFEYNSEEDKHKFYLGYFIRLSKSAGLLLKQETYALIVHIQILVYGSYSYDSDTNDPNLDFSSVKIIIDTSLEDGTYFITPLNQKWPFLRNLRHFLDPSPGPSTEPVYKEIGTSSQQYKIEFLHHLLAQIGSLKESISEELGIPSRKIEVISKN